MNGGALRAYGIEIYGGSAIAKSCGEHDASECASLACLNLQQLEMQILNLAQGSNQGRPGTSHECVRRQSEEISDVVFGEPNRKQ